MNELSAGKVSCAPDRGMSADAGATAIFILVVVGLIAAGVWSMWGKKVVVGLIAAGVWSMWGKK
ncbi:hypothetical protein N4Q68_30020, partial [Salmonella enterica subsp. enterica serovar Montevideo]